MLVSEVEISKKIESFLCWNRENYDDIYNELCQLEDLLTAGDIHFKKGESKEVLQKNSVKNYKNVIRQLYAFTSTTAKIEHLIRGTKLIASNERYIKYLLEPKQLEYFSLDKNYIELFLTIRNIRTVIDHAKGKTFTWDTVGFEETAVIIMHGHGELVEQTKFEILKRYDAVSSGRIKYDDVVEKLLSDNKFVEKGTEWIIVLPPVKDIKIMIDEIYKIHEKMYRVHKESIG